MEIYKLKKVRGKDINILKKREREKKKQSRSVVELKGKEQGLSTFGFANFPSPPNLNKFVVL